MPTNIYGTYVMPKIILDYIVFVAFSGVYLLCLSSVITLGFKNIVEVH